MAHNQITCPNRIALPTGKKGAYPTEVGALASVFEKLATELKQNLLKCKHTIQIATFNVRILNRIGQLLERTASAIDHNIDIICIQEQKYTHNKDIKYHDSCNGWTQATASASAWKNSVNATKGDVGTLTGPRALKSLNRIEKIQPRMMVETLMATPTQQSSPATPLPMLVKKLNSSPSMMSNPPLFVVYRNTTFSSLAET